MLYYAERMESLIGHIAVSVPELGHIDPGRVLVGVSRTRKRRGRLLAHVTPMRFEGGRRTAVRKGVVWSAPGLVVRGREILYVIRFLMPRFQNLGFDDKLATVFHELYHISPEFNGDLRRFHGRNSIHTSSGKRFHDRARRLAESYLEALDDPGRVDFLRPNFAALNRKFGPVAYRTLRIGAPRAIGRAGQMELEFQEPE